MLIEEERIKQDKTRSDELEKILQKEIEEGISAERLVVNKDWIRIKEKLEEGIKGRIDQKLQVYDSLLRPDLELSSEQKIKAIDRIRFINQEIDDFNFILYYPEKCAMVGKKAKEELLKIREEKND